MRIRSFRSILDDCLDAMQRGESVDGCLSRYPRQADRLRPLLQLAERVRRTRPVTPRPWAQATSWNLVRRHASDMRAGKRRHLTDAGHGIGWVRPAAVAAALLAALALGTGGTALAAQNALPNSPLYRVKLATEDVRLWFVFDDKHKADILLAQSNERTSEILAMVSKGEPVPENVLSTLSDRNGRAAEILAGQSDAGELSEKLRYQTEAQERLLLALWPDVEESAQGEYAQAVADIHNIRLSRGGALVAAVDPEELSAGVVNISGVAQKVSDGAWSVGGVEVRIDDKTIDSSQLESGVTGDFIVARSSNGRLHVLSFTNVKPDQSPAQAVVSGQLEEIEDGRIRVAGQWIPIDQDTVLKQIKQGKRVEVKLNNTAKGVVASRVSAGTQALASEDEADDLIYEGPIEGDFSRLAKSLVIGGIEFNVTPGTRFDLRGGSTADGARAEVEAAPNKDGKLEADVIRVLATGEDQPPTVSLIGSYERGRGGAWVVSGQEVTPKAGIPEPEDKSLVAIEAEERGGALTMIAAKVIQSPKDGAVGRIEDVITGLDGATWKLGLGDVRVDSKTPLAGEPIVGARVIVWGRQSEDGSFQATYARVLDRVTVLQQPAPSPTPEP